MKEIKNAISNAQKAAQKKYDQKTKMVSIKYTLSDMSDYQKLKSYLARSGKSANRFIKDLIDNFFESGQDHEKPKKMSENPVIQKKDRAEEYYPYSWISEESLQFLYANFGKKIMVEILDHVFDVIEAEIDNIIEDKGCGFNDWIKEVEEQMEDGEFQNKTRDEICKKLVEDLYCNL